MLKNLVGQPVLARDGGTSIGSILSPQVCLSTQEVKLWNKKRSSFLLLRYAWEARPQDALLAPGRAGGGVLSLHSYLVTRSLWMSRRSKSGVDDHEDESLRSSLGNHKP